MSDGSVEVRKLSFQAEATQLVKATNQAATSLDKVNLAVGMTAKEMNSAQRAIDKAQEKMEKAAGAAARLKQKQKDLNKELTQSNKTVRDQAQRIITLNQKLVEQTAKYEAASAMVKELTARNLGLAKSYEIIGAKAKGVNQVTQGVGGKKANVGVFGIESERNQLALKQEQQSRKGELRLLREDIQDRYRVAAQTQKVEENKLGTKKPFDSITQDGQLMFSNALRYQLYDVAATFGIVGAAATAAGTAIFRTGIEWDKNFANVVRTSQVTGTAVHWLKEQFLDLQSEIPITAADLATIATLGAQMGVAAGHLAEFTEVTGKFSAASGINVDESATVLSRLDQLLPDVAGNYERLASTILLTGVNAVATEEQIARGTSQIAGLARIADLTTPEVVALSSAMSSLGFSPELQRSVVTSSFSRILTATSQVTEKTQAFGKVLNITGQEFQTAWRKDAIGTYEELLKAIASRGDAVTVLQGLGLASQRLTPNLLKLGQNTDVLDRALADTTRGWSENTELSRQYGIIADTVSAKIQVLGQSWEAFLVTLDTSETVIGPVVDGLTWLVHTMRDIANNPAAASIATVGSVLLTVVGITALGVAGLAALSAGFIAITNSGVGINTVLAEYDALQAGGVVATEANTAATVRNTVAKTGNAAATEAQVVATGASTGALTANALASNGASIGMLRFSGKVLGAIPALLKGVGLFGLITAAVTAVGVAVATAPDWTYDMEKFFNGIDTPTKTFVYNTKRIKDAMNEVSTLTQEVARADAATRRGRPSEEDQTIDFSASANLSKAKVDLERISKDTVDEVLGLQTMEEKYSAVNDIASALGITQQELLSHRLPELGDALGSNAADMAVAQDATEKLQAAQELWAISLGTIPDDLASLQSGLKTGAKSFLDFGQALTNAYDKDASNGEGFASFQQSMNKSISDFESFYGKLGKLVDRGGIQLAGLFAAQGPEATQALTDSLKLSGDQLHQIEDQMSLAAFYASDEFANVFSQNHALLAQVFQRTGGNQAAVADFNTLLEDSFKSGSIDTRALADLAAKYNINLPIDMVPAIDKDKFNAYLALASAQITPVKIPVVTEVGGIPGQTVDSWIVTMEGHTIVLPVDPNTEAGAALIDEWRKNEYATPLSIKTFVDTRAGDAALQKFRDMWNNSTVDFKIRTSYAYNSGTVGGIPMGATGALIANNRLVRKNYPGFANGTILRGPGTGTSDSMLARVSNGEAITQARAVRFWGTEFMEDVNRMRLPRFAQGTFGAGPSGGNAGVHVSVVQNYPQTVKPLDKLKEEAEKLVAGLWAA